MGPCNSMADGVDSASAADLGNDVGRGAARNDLDLGGEDVLGSADLRGERCWGVGA
jgi:hypothetical protein